MNASTPSRLRVISSLLIVALLATACGRLRPNAGSGDEPGAAATFTAVAPLESQPTAAPATALPNPTATVPPAPTTTPTQVATVVPPPTQAVVQGDPSGDALEDFLGGLGNNAADDSAILTELDQVP
ncbi:MAG: hypothetical protein JNL73_17410 [Anaerolineales bacterium]|nr:hypothetical protein [Anaerolineales bacterium]